MSGSHVINLSTAWDPPEPAAGREAWTRRFGMPAGIEPGDQVFLVIEAAATCGATLAGAPLPSVVAGLSWRQDVTERLGPRNELVLIPAAALVPEFTPSKQCQSPKRPSSCLVTVRMPTKGLPSFVVTLFRNRET
jgi:hypothetical protein